MKNYRSDAIRNIGLFAHSGAGKTSLAEAALFNAGVIDRIGKVDEGNTLCDFDPEEIKRCISISTSLAPVEWKNVKINFLDTPGYFDFVGEVKSAARVVESALIVTCAVSGVEVGTEQVGKICEGMPSIFFINKMDRENANFNKVLGQIREFFGPKAIPLQLPIGAEADFNGLVDLLNKKAYTFAGKDIKEAPVPDNLSADMENYRTMLVEAVAETDDELLMKYLEGETLTDAELQQGLCQGVLDGSIRPILCGSALTNKGISLLLDFIASCMPSPKTRPPQKATDPQDDSQVLLEVSEDAPFSALVFKTMADPYVGKLTLFKVFSGELESDSTIYNVTKEESEKTGQLYTLRGKKQINLSKVCAGDIAALAKLQHTSTNDTLANRDKPLLLPPIDFPTPVLTMTAQPKSKGDEDKISSGLARLSEEDMTFLVDKDPETAQVLVSGMGEIHLEVLAGKLSNKFGADMVLDTPKVPYRETIRGTSKAEGKHRKQSGGRGQFGHVWIEFTPLDSFEEEYEFVDNTFGGSVPKQYVPAVDKGLQEALEEGVLAGYPMVGVKAILYDGSFHPVDSSEMAFKVAASLAYKKGIAEARPVLLEPIMDYTIIVPNNYMGDIIGDLNKRRGRVLGMEPVDGVQHIKAQVPMAEMFKYATDLRSMTQGRGSFSFKFSHYEEVPSPQSEKVIEEARESNN